MTIDKTQLAITLVVLAIIATVGILVVGEMASADFEEEAYETETPYADEDPQLMFINLLMIATATFILIWIGHNHRPPDINQDGDRDG